MARQAKLRKKTSGKFQYWFTKAGGDTYLGNVDEVPRKEAKRRFADHPVSLQNDSCVSKKSALTADNWR